MVQSSATVGAAALRRQQMTGKKGISALMDNKHAFFIAIFASFGGLLYGYQQGVLGQALVMPAFIEQFPDVHNSATATGWLTSILQLGGWLGAITSGVLCEVFSRKHSIAAASLWVILGSYLCAGASNSSYLLAGRFFTGIGVGTLSAVGPLYNAELAPPEIRGFLVALQQLTTTIGILLAYWIAYGTSHIGGTGEGQSQWAWRLPLIAQGIPAVILSIGVWFMPFSPRLLMNKGREEEALQTLANLRGLPKEHILVQIEHLEIKSEVVFERRAFAKRFPLLGGDNQSIFKREIAQYTNIFRSKDSFKRVALGSLVMFFQQWTGIDSIIYYAPVIFQSLGLTSGTSALLATGITGIINVATTIPAILVIDKVGRRPLALIGSVHMFVCQIIIGVIVATCQDNWKEHAAAGWVAVVMVWLYIVGFAYSWGPVSWTLIAEIFPLSIRAKGTSISASSNWMNNFIIAFITPPMLKSISWGTYIFFAAWLALGGAFIWFFIPETKGKTLEEMDAAFGSHSSVEDIEELARVQQEVGLTDLLNGEHVMPFDGLEKNGAEVEEVESI
ncbi:general substrate transporter [Aureobasidium subglaciale]|nr:general substrate transporter [Aureobasidium subglaciale]